VAGRLPPYPVCRGAPPLLRLSSVRYSLHQASLGLDFLVRSPFFPSVSEFLFRSGGRAYGFLLAIISPTPPPPVGVARRSSGPAIFSAFFFLFSPRQVLRLETISFPLPFLHLRSRRTSFSCSDFSYFPPTSPTSGCYGGMPGPSPPLQGSSGVPYNWKPLRTFHAP